MKTASTTVRFIIGNPLGHQTRSASQIESSADFRVLERPDGAPVIFINLEVKVTAVFRAGSVQPRVPDYSNRLAGNDKASRSHCRTLQMRIAVKPVRQRIKYDDGVPA